jgi:hypothetical protein
MRNPFVSIAANSASGRLRSVSKDQSRDFSSLTSSLTAAGSTPAADG